MKSRTIIIRHVKPGPGVRQPHWNIWSSKGFSDAPGKPARWGQCAAGSRGGCIDTLSELGYFPPEKHA